MGIRALDWLEAEHCRGGWCTKMQNVGNVICANITRALSADVIRITRIQTQFGTTVQNLRRNAARCADGTDCTEGSVAAAVAADDGQ